MAKKPSQQYTCESCGAQSTKWSGKCANCEEWNTLVEQVVSSHPTIQTTGKRLSSTTLNAVKTEGAAQRYSTTINQLDEVLGGGLVAGSVCLIAGEPGIGKSTLLLQTAHALAKNKKVLYVSAEESAHQIKLRSDRLKNTSPLLELATSTSTDNIVQTINEAKYDVVIVDSIQTIATSAQATNPGTVSQITASSHVLTSAAKQTNTALIIVGHVTKEGSIAGPKVLEHLVDVVLNLEGDRYGGFKLLRTVKNRYGSTNEVGIFEMLQHGLSAVENPSAALLEERHESDGSVVLATLEGSRPMLVEVQALVTKSEYGYPKRTASGFDQNRLNLLIAMLSKRTSLNLSDKDVFVNIVGGLKVVDPAADLAVCMAIGSAAKGLKLSDNYVVYGEVGLSGEVRHVYMQEKRIAEAKKLGFAGAVGPRSSTGGSFLKPARTVRDALNAFLEKAK